MSEFKDGRPPRTDCCLCAQVEGRAKGDLLHRLLGGSGYVRRVAAENEHSVAIPSLGPLAPGHSLICPRRHARSLAELDPEERGDLLALADQVAAALGALRKAPVHRFEHGDAREGHEVSCSVEHAHLHLLSTEADPWPALRAELPWAAIAGPEDLTHVTAGREYLLYVTPDGECHVHLREGSIPSQLLRLRFAEAIGNPEDWNWRATPQVEATAKTFEDLQAALA